MAVRYVRRVFDQCVVTIDYTVLADHVRIVVEQGNLVHSTMVHTANAPPLYNITNAEVTIGGEIYIYCALDGERYRCKLYLFAEKHSD